MERLLTMGGGCTCFMKVGLSNRGPQVSIITKLNGAFIGNEANERNAFFLQLQVTCYINGATCDGGSTFCGWFRISDANSPFRGVQN